MDSCNDIWPWNYQWFELAFNALNPRLNYGTGQMWYIHTSCLYDHDSCEIISSILLFTILLLYSVSFATYGAIASLFKGQNYYLKTTSLAANVSMSEPLDQMLDD